MVNALVHQALLTFSIGPFDRPGASWAVVVGVLRILISFLTLCGVGRRPHYYHACPPPPSAFSLFIVMMVTCPSSSSADIQNSSVG